MMPQIKNLNLKIFDLVHHVNMARDQPYNLILNISYLTGEPIDERGPIKTEHFAPIHAEALDFVDMSVEQIFVTGIKVVDLLAPYSKVIMLDYFFRLIQE